MRLQGWTGEDSRRRYTMEMVSIECELMQHLTSLAPTFIVFPAGKALKVLRTNMAAVCSSQESLSRPNSEFISSPLPCPEAKPSRFAGLSSSRADALLQESDRSGEWSGASSGTRWHIHQLAPPVEIPRFLLIPSFNTRMTQSNGPGGVHSKHI